MGSGDAVDDDKYLWGKRKNNGGRARKGWGHLTTRWQNKIMEKQKSVCVWEHQDAVKWRDNNFIHSFGFVEVWESRTEL